MKPKFQSLRNLFRTRRCVMPQRTILRFQITGDSGSAGGKGWTLVLASDNYFEKRSTPSNTVEEENDFRSIYQHRDWPRR